MSAPDLTIIVPAFNEEEAIVETLQELKREFGDAEVLVIDDGSTDRTAENAARIPGIRVVRHDANRGYGASIRTGIRNARGTLVAWYDADGQHTPEGLRRVVQTLESEGLHAAVAARTADSAFVRSRKIPRAILGLIVQMAAGRRIPDINCGLRVFRRSVIRRYAHLLPNGFSASITSTLLMLKRGYRMQFVPVSTRARVGRSSVRMIRDGLLSIQTSLRILVLFQAFQAFSILAALLFGTGTVYGLYVALTHGLGFPALAVVLVISGVIVFLIGLLTDQVVALRMERLEETDLLSDSSGDPF